MATNRPLPRHLLVLRLSAMGDVAMLPFAVGALRKQYPQLKITVATQPRFKPFFHDLDIEFLPVDLKGEFHGFKGLVALSRRLRLTGADAFADVHGVLRSTFIRMSMRLHGIRVASIDKGRREKRMALKGPYCDDKYLKHTVIRYCDTLRSLGFEFEDPQPAVKRELPNPLPEASGRLKVGFAPFSAHAGKSCPEALRRAVTEELSRRFDRVFIHGGGGDEARFAHQMEQLYPNVTAVFGKLASLGDEMNLISNEDCMVSMDSLAMHMAALVATPVVSVWGATHPRLGFLGYGSPREGIVQSRLDCRPCSVYGNRECRFGTYTCLTTISAKEVADRALQLAQNR